MGSSPMAFSSLGDRQKVRTCSRQIKKVPSEVENELFNQVIQFYESVDSRKVRYIHSLRSSAEL